MSEERAVHLSWTCSECREPCGEHPRAERGAMVQGYVVTCFRCWPTSAWEEAWRPLRVPSVKEGPA